MAILLAENCARWKQSPWMCQWSGCMPQLRLTRYYLQTIFQWALYIADIENVRALVPVHILRKLNHSQLSTALWHDALMYSAVLHSFPYPWIWPWHLSTAVNELFFVRPSTSARVLSVCAGNRTHEENTDSFVWQAQDLACQGSEHDLRHARIFGCEFRKAGKSIIFGYSLETYNGTAGSICKLLEILNI